MSKRPDKKSIFSIWASTSKERKVNLGNYFLVLLFMIPSLFISVHFDPFKKDDFRSIIGYMLSVNGGILGLTIAGFSFSSAIPRDLISFASSSKATEYPWSNYKQILLNFLYCFVALFSSLTLLFIFMLLTYVNTSFLGEYRLVLKHFFMALIWSVQGFVFAELKIFLFWLYENSLMLGMATAIQDEKEPWDTGNA